MFFSIYTHEGRREDRYVIEDNTLVMKGYLAHRTRLTGIGNIFYLTGEGLYVFNRGGGGNLRRIIKCESHPAKIFIFFRNKPNA